MTKIETLLKDVMLRILNLRRSLSLIVTFERKDLSLTEIRKGEGQYRKKISDGHSLLPQIFRRDTESLDTHSNTSPRREPIQNQPLYRNPPNLFLP